MEILLTLPLFLSGTLIKIVSIFHNWGEGTWLVVVITTPVFFFTLLILFGFLLTKLTYKYSNKNDSGILLKKHRIYFLLIILLLTIAIYCATNISFYYFCRLLGVNPSLGFFS